MKVHIGSGSVYLDGWLNVDVPDNPQNFLAVDRPDLVNRWKTTDDAYYARHNDKTIDRLRKGPLLQEYVCDVYGSFLKLPDQAWNADEVLARQSFEHLSIEEAKKALASLRTVMKPGGLLRIDVPDHEATLNLFKETGDEFYIRHLLGPRRTDRGFHMMSYTRERLIGLLEQHGFKYDGEEENIHFYPAFCLRFRLNGKNGTVEQALAPREYVKLPKIGGIMADVGPGTYPHPRADVYIDYRMDHLTPLQGNGKRTILSSLEDGLPEIADQEFNYVWCSHVLEHVENPAACAVTLSRIAPAGTVVLPSAVKDILFNFEEATHKWLVWWATHKGGPPVFVRHNAEHLARIKDTLVQQAMCYLYRTGSDHDCTAEQYLRKWYTEHEKDLDVIVHWTGKLELQVIG